MALSEQTINKHNIKRAEVFAANGLCDLDIAFAHPEFTGYANADVDCTLCGHRHIKWLFAIRFDAPDALTALGKVSTGIVRKDAVTLKPVGSKCITDWLDALPETAEKLQALKTWHKELSKANAAKSLKAMENKLKKLGFADQAALSDALYAVLTEAQEKGVHLKWSTRNKIKSYAKKAKKGYFKSPSPVNTAHGYLVAARKKIDAAPTPAPKSEPKVASAPKDELAHLTADTKDAILRGRAAWKTGKGNLNKTQQDAFADIGKKVVKHGFFKSPKQRAFYEKLLGYMLPAKTKPAVPGDASFKSPSGLIGARY
jgi:hypothetical protein